MDYYFYSIMENKLLNQIATEIVMDKVMEDKMKEFEKANQEEPQNDQDNKKNEQQKDNQDDDELFNSDDSEEERIMKREKEKRINSLGVSKGKPQRDRSREKKGVSNKYGQYFEIEESNFLDTLLKNEKVVCHFYHNEFDRCKIMDKHLITIAAEHPETLFVKINAEKSPFFCTRLNIRTLPTVLYSKNGKVYQRQIGFEELEGGDDFKLITLKRKMVLAKIITPRDKHESGEITMKKKGKLFQEESSDEN